MKEKLDLIVYMIASGVKKQEDIEFHFINEYSELTEIEVQNYLDMLINKCFISRTIFEKENGIDIYYSLTQFGRINLDLIDKQVYNH